VTSSNQELVDLWLWPADLPADIAVASRPLPHNRHWRFTKEDSQLLPMPAVSVAELVEVYRDEPAMGYHQLKWMLENPTELPEEWRPYKIYFLGFEFRKEPWLGHVYSIQFKDGVWHRNEERFDSKIVKSTARIILMR
jgi:hypothetical protein